MRQDRATGIRSRLAPAVEDELRMLYATRSRSPAEIHRRLVDKFGEGHVSLKTVQSRVRALDRLDTSAQWDVRDADPADAAVLLDTLAAVIHSTMGNIRHLTVREAGLVVAFRAGRPEMDALDAWRLAAECARRGDLSTEDIAAYLAFAPWRSDVNATLYKTAVDRGWVLPPPRFLRQPVLTAMAEQGLDLDAAMTALEAIEAETEEEQDG